MSLVSPHRSPQTTKKGERITPLPLGYWHIQLSRRPSYFVVRFDTPRLLLFRLFLVLFLTAMCLFPPILGCTALGGRGNAGEICYPPTFIPNLSSTIFQIFTISTSLSARVTGRYSSKHSTTVMNNL